MKILVTGGNGQVGSELKDISFQNYSYNWVFSDVTEFDLTNLNRIQNFLDKVNPDIIVNCAAYTDVDNAEKEFELAEIINSKAVDKISKWSSKNNSKLIHLSTDYVFDGNSSIPLGEEAKTCPLNIYGKTKLQGEINCLNNDSNSIIIRTSWVYSQYGKNFVKTMRNLMFKNKTLNIVMDQIGSPTYAKDLANAILQIISHNEWVPGIFHFTNKGEISWFDFARLVKKYFEFDVKINPVSSSFFPTIAKRPSYNLLDKTKISKTYGIIIKKYEFSLEKFIKILKNEK